VRTDGEGNVLWDRSFGGTGSDTLSSLQETFDGGFILGGTSTSAPSGNKTSPSYGYDYWLVRLDANGEKLWDLTYGAGGEVMKTVRQTPDGGFLLGGTSMSDIGGNKTSTNHNRATGAGPAGPLDYWVVRTDAQGNKLWERQLGGLDTDRFGDLVALPDGGVVLAGNSASGINGTKTAPSFGGSYDYWVIRLDANGNQIWDRTFGGGPSAERLCAIAATSGNGFVLFGESVGTALMGNKESPPYGSFDYWIVQLDGDGNKLWDQSFGGTDADGIDELSQPVGRIVSVSNGLVMAGPSVSGISGNKTVPNLGGRDFWIIKLGENVESEIATSVSSISNAVVECQQVTNSLGVWNRGSGTVFYTISTDVPWATISPTNGFSSDETNFHMITYASTGQAVGTHEGNVTIIPTTPGATATRVRLSLTVTPPPAPELQIRKFAGREQLLLGPTACSTIAEFSTNLVDWFSYRTNPPASTEREIPRATTTAPYRFYRVRIP
jgi:hypothetical protein